MLGVKIVILLVVITFVWNILVQAMIRGMNPIEKIKLMQSQAEGKMPWWYILDGFLVLICLLGLIYLAAYFLFIFLK